MSNIYTVRNICVTALLLFIMMAQSAVASISVPIGRSELVEVPVDMGEVIVANPDIADIYVHGKNRLSIIGKGYGNTTVRVFDEESKLIRSIDVNVGYDLPAIHKALREFLPYENITIKMVNSNIALTGEVSSVSSAEKAMKIVREFVEPQIGIGKDGKSSRRDPKARPKILNLVSVTGGQQVMLRVRVGEIRRTALRNMGVNLEAIKNGASNVVTIATGGGIDAFRVGSELSFGGYTIGNNSRGIISATHTNSAGDGLSAMLEALERNGLFKTLAEPNLVAMSGEQAQFLAGGEFPIPVTRNLGDITIEYKPFGVSVKFKPFVLAENRIRIAVEPEVSQLSTEAGIIINGFDIPALNTRRAKTTIELAPGESFMIAGLIQDEMRSTIDQIPGLGEIPILSALFRSTAYQRDETELVIAVTPYLVDPLASSDVKLPTDNFRPASAMENLFYGALGSLNGDARRLSQMPTVEGPIGFMVD